MKKVRLKNNLRYSNTIIIFAFIIFLFTNLSYAYIIQNNTAYTLNVADHGYLFKPRGINTTIKPYQTATCNPTVNGCYGTINLSVSTTTKITTLCIKKIQIAKGERGHVFTIKQIKNIPPTRGDFNWCQLDHYRQQGYIVSHLKSLEVPNNWNSYLYLPWLKFYIQDQGGYPYGLPGYDKSQGFIKGLGNVGIAVVGKPEYLIINRQQPAVSYLPPFYNAESITQFSPLYGININNTNQGKISWAVVASYKDSETIQSIYLPAQPGDLSCQDYFSLGFNERPYRVFSLTIKPWNVNQVRIFSADVKISTVNGSNSHLIAQLFNCSIE